MLAGDQLHQGQAGREMFWPTTTLLPRPTATGSPPSSPTAALEQADQWNIAQSCRQQQFLDASRRTTGEGVVGAQGNRPGGRFHDTSARPRREHGHLGRRAVSPARSRAGARRHVVRRGQSARRREDLHRYPGRQRRLTGVSSRARLSAGRHGDAGHAKVD